jgi:hypothetical protein
MLKSLNSLPKLLDRFLRGRIFDVVDEGHAVPTVQSGRPWNGTVALVDRQPAAIRSGRNSSYRDAELRKATRRTDRCFIRLT